MSSDILEKCEVCGGLLDIYTEGRTQGLICKSCGWSLVTTINLEINNDNNEYSIRCSGNFSDSEHVRVVASVVGANFIEARKLLKQGSFVIFNGKAPEVYDVIKNLQAAGLDFQVDPHFKWI
ncbi:hypothetical protein [Xanthomonas arboricola]|uniref:hypothetical protein n=1 Tax=Xanthomonas arboricola TaxID=56448 RepID=UPI0011AED886|nr:hypothetical protein [Xanthomonas arboricola]